MLVIAIFIVFTPYVSSIGSSDQNAEIVLNVAAKAVATSAREYEMGCRDHTPLCPDLAKLGLCDTNSTYMYINCPVSCNTCLPSEPSECVNREEADEESCNLSAILGQCEVNYAYNLRFCPGSCRNTQSLKAICFRKQGTNTKPDCCVDLNPSCPGWGELGQCNDNPAYMLDNCPVTCNSCRPYDPKNKIYQKEFCCPVTLKEHCLNDPFFSDVTCAKTCSDFIPVDKTQVQHKYCQPIALIGYGEEQVEGHTPRAVGIDERYRFACGGAPITPFHVLTAAQCVNPQRARRPNIVRVGEIDFHRVDESLAFDYGVAEINIHPEYNSLSNYNDIAIITLKQKIEYTDELRPFSLPKSPMNLDGLNGIVSGFGTRPNAPASTILRIQEVQVVGNDVCNAAYSKAPATFKLIFPREFDDTSLCATGGPICRGNSGGPLVVKDETNVPLLVGIVSQGVGCGSPDYPAIFTRVDTYTEWIRDVIFSGC